MYLKYAWIWTPAFFNHNHANNTESQQEPIFSNNTHCRYDMFHSIHTQFWLFTFGVVVLVLISHDLFTNFVRVSPLLQDQSCDWGNTHQAGSQVHNYWDVFYHWWTVNVDIILVFRHIFILIHIISWSIYILLNEYIGFDKLHSWHKRQ